MENRYFLLSLLWCGRSTLSWAGGFGRKRGIKRGKSVSAVSLLCRGCPLPWVYVSEEKGKPNGEKRVSFVSLLCHGCPHPWTCVSEGKGKSNRKNRYLSLSLLCCEMSPAFDVHFAKKREIKREERSIFRSALVLVDVSCLARAVRKKTGKLKGKKYLSHRPCAVDDPCLGRAFRKETGNQTGKIGGLSHGPSANSVRRAVKRHISHADRE